MIYDGWLHYYLLLLAKPEPLPQNRDDCSSDKTPFFLPGVDAILLLFLYDNDLLLQNCVKSKQIIKIFLNTQRARNC